LHVALSEVEEDSVESVDQLVLSSPGLLPGFLLEAIGEDDEQVHFVLNALIQDVDGLVIQLRIKQEYGVNKQALTYFSEYLIILG
jgi:hypothetical protein